MFSSETYAIEDCKLYATMSKIKSDWLKDTSVSGRTIYKLMTAYNTDVELTFKLQTSIPSNYLIGFGDTGGSPAYWSKCAWYNDNNTLKIFKNNDWVNIGAPTKTLDTVYKLRTSNLHTITPYLNNTSYAAQSTNSGHSLNLRVDDFGNVLDIEYLKVKPL